MVNKENINRALFLSKVIDEYVSKITGQNEVRVVNIDGKKSPEDRFYVGKLSPKGIDNDKRSSKTNINQIGVDFIIRQSDLSEAVIKVSPRGEFYYRVFPTLEEQAKAIEERDKIIQSKRETKFKDLQDAEEDTDFEQYESPEQKAKESMDIVPVYEKASIGDGRYDIEVKLTDIFDYSKGVGYVKYHNDFIKILDKTRNEIRESPNTYRVVRERVNVSTFEDEESWREYLIKKSESTSVIPKWEFSIEVEVKHFNNDLLKVSIHLINETMPERYGRRLGKANLDILFNSGLKIEILGSDYQPINLEYFNDDYKYDKTQRGIGHNCSVIWSEKNPRVLETTHLPLFKQYRLKTREDLVVKFKDLINEPVKTLKDIYSKMLQELESWRNDYSNRKHCLASDVESNYKACKQFEEEIKAFEFEIKRFKYGISMIEDYDYIKNAFILMNKAFARSTKSYDSWRLFQIVFIVSLLPDVSVCEYGEEKIDNSFINKVDLLYFPTGGGKTEAFLGIIVFTLFFDRFRGKVSGNTAIVKYPLRLLSVQQVGRMADILASAEIERKNCQDIKDSDIFSLGYYVGDVNTPNSLKKEVVDEMTKKSQSELNEDYKIIDKCPFCQNKNINIMIDTESLRLLHVCSNKDCPSGGVLPLYIVDREIYRYIPSVIISTIDKLAAVGYQSDFRNIFGEVTHKCPVHGYTSKTQCTEKEVCKVDVVEYKDVDLYDPAPTLLIQDELHLIRESLGAFDAHYETFFQYMIANLTKSKKKIKIIGATATISFFESQLYHLYLKDGIRFPCQSPYLDRNFYSYVDKTEINRFILGYAPYGKAIINSVVYSMKYLKQIIWDYYKNPSKMMDIEGIDIKNEEEVYDILKDYWIFLEYNNVKLDGNRVLSALDDPINTELDAEGIQPFDERKMTGDDTFQDVRRILAEVETTKNVFEGFNLIAATSMISHGVDADKFNLMFFFGMPGNTAEYIQAYSRCGRKYPGLIIMIMRPAREKDQSYLKNFVKFHEYKDILVEPVPINRWATKAVEKTLPGIFAGIIINHYDKHLQYEFGNIYQMKNLKEAIKNGRVNKEEVINHILRAYGCIRENGTVEELGNQYREYIIEKINYIFNEILTKSYDAQDYYILDGIEKLGSGLYSPMRSLRDTDKPVKIKLD